MSMTSVATGTVSARTWVLITSDLVTVSSASARQASSASSAHTYVCVCWDEVTTTIWDCKPGQKLGPDSGSVLELLPNGAYYDIRWRQFVSNRIERPGCDVHHHCSLCGYIGCALTKHVPGGVPERAVRLSAPRRYFGLTFASTGLIHRFFDVHRL